LSGLFVAVIVIRQDSLNRPFSRHGHQKHSTNRRRILMCRVAFRIICPVWERTKTVHT